MKNLEEFLNSKPLSYSEIDLSRMPKAFEYVRTLAPQPRTIHIVGTNGKGTTGRFLASVLKENNFSVLHYTSPHIFKLNERFWLNGENISDEVLDEAHKLVFDSLPENLIKSVSYFEYTTLLIYGILKIKNSVDFLILEAGLGGEFDATNVFDKELSIFTNIGIDHKAFLGEKISEIATTKINSIQENKKSLIALQTFGDEVYDIFKKIAKNKNNRYFFVKNLIDDSQQRDIKNYLECQNIEQLYLNENFYSVISALKILNLNINFKVKNLELLSGRMQKFRENIYLDVGHNLLATEKIFDFFISKNINNISLIYNSLQDKEYSKILKKLKNIVSEVLIIDIQDDKNRAEVVDKNNLIKIIKSLNLSVSDFKKENLDSKKIYLVFGSFRVVEEFLKIYNQKNYV
jgi:dihydrofolate synthase/folylpolyglutamate synthase